MVTLPNTESNSVEWNYFIKKLQCIAIIFDISTKLTPLSLSTHASSNKSNSDPLAKLGLKSYLLMLFLLQLTHTVDIAIQ